MIARRWIAGLAVVAAAGCSDLGEPGEAVAIEFLVPNPARVEVGDTIVLRARLLDQNGDSADSGALRWRTPDTTVAVDSITGQFWGLISNGTTARVQPTGGTLVGPIATFTVFARADTLMVETAAESLLVAVADSESTLLGAKVAQFDGTGLGLRTMIVRVITPLDGSVVLDNLTINDTLDILVDTVSTTSGGLSALLVKVRGTRPDSAVVEFEARHVSDAVVAGSGQRIRIFFE